MAAKALTLTISESRQVRTPHLGFTRALFHPSEAVAWRSGKNRFVSQRTTLRSSKENIKLLYPFGYGLSYTTFSYRGLGLPKKTIHAGDPVIAEVTVANTGMREGDEVVQLYLTFPEVPGAPLRALRGFKRVRLKPGESQNVRFELRDRDLSMVTEAGEPIIAEGKYSVSIGGGQPNTGAPAVERTFKGGKKLCRSRNRKHS